jgi:hypothetical protein
VIRSYQKVGGKKRIIVAEHYRYRPESIPAYLEPDWHERYFSHLTAAPVKFLRRTAAVQLVQWVAGGSLGDAGRCQCPRHAVTEPEIR